MFRAMRTSERAKVTAKKTHLDQSIDLQVHNLKLEVPLSSLDNAHVSPPVYITNLKPTFKFQVCDLFYY